MNYTNLDKMTKLSTSSMKVGRGKPTQSLSFDFYECFYGKTKFFCMTVSPLKLPLHAANALIDFNREQTFDSISLSDLEAIREQLMQNVDLYLC